MEIVYCSAPRLYHTVCKTDSASSVVRRYLSKVLSKWSKIFVTRVSLPSSPSISPQSVFATLRWRTFWEARSAVRFEMKNGDMPNPDLGQMKMPSSKCLIMRWRQWIEFSGARSVECSELKLATFRCRDTSLHIGQSLGLRHHSRSSSVLGAKRESWSSTSIVFCGPLSFHHHFEIQISRLVRIDECALWSLHRSLIFCLANSLAVSCDKILSSNI